MACWCRLSVCFRISNNCQSRRSRDLAKQVFRSSLCSAHPFVVVFLGGVILETAVQTKQSRGYLLAKSSPFNTANESKICHLVIFYDADELQWDLGLGFYSSLLV